MPARSLSASSLAKKLKVPFIVLRTIVDAMEDQGTVDLDDSYADKNNPRDVGIILTITGVKYVREIWEKEEKEEKRVNALTDLSDIDEGFKELINRKTNPVGMGRAPIKESIKAVETENRPTVFPVTPLEKKSKNQLLPPVNEWIWPKWVIVSIKWISGIAAMVFAGWILQSC